MTGRNRKARAFLCLGGNLGEPERAMAEALQALDASPGICVIRVSSVYRTPPWGKLDQPEFLNAAAEIETGLTPHELLSQCLAIERMLKRERRDRWGPRVIDIDILTYDDERIADAMLEIPHPRMLQRAFVLLPLAEIAPGLVLEGKSISEHMARLDASGVEPVKTGGEWWKNEAIRPLTRSPS